MAKRRSKTNQEAPKKPETTATNNASQPDHVKPLYRKKHNIEDVHPFKDTNGRARKLPKEMVIARRILILQEFSRGKSPEVIAYEIGTSEEIVIREIDIALEKIAEEYTHASPAQIFAKYATFQFGVLNKIQKAYERFTADTSMKSASAQISALKTQSDIYDKIIQKGIDFGIIQHKRKKTTQDIQSQNPEQLAAILQQEISEMLIMLKEINPKAASKLTASLSPQQNNLQSKNQNSQNTKQSSNKSANKNQNQQTQTPEQKTKSIPKHKRKQLKEWMFKKDSDDLKEKELSKALELQAQLHKDSKNSK